MYLKIYAYLPRSGHIYTCRYIKIFFIYTLRFVQFGHKAKRDSWIDYRVFKRRPRNDSKHGEFMAANEEAISSLVCHLYRALTEEVPRERSWVSGDDSINVEEELSRKPLLCNPRLNYGSYGSSRKKRKLRSSSWKGKSAKESLHSITTGGPDIEYD